MPTVRCSGRPGGVPGGRGVFAHGGVCAGYVCPEGIPAKGVSVLWGVSDQGVSAYQGDVCLQGDVADTLPREQNDRHV